MTSYRTKLNNLQLKLGSLLTHKKALNSKVVCHEFEKFQECAKEVLLGRGNTNEVRITLIDLERALKQEGLFKILKAEFVTLKKSFLSAPSKTPILTEDEESVDTEHRRTVRTTTAVISRQSYVKDSESDKSTPTHIPVALSELKNVHKAVGALFHHLDISKSSSVSPSFKHYSKAKQKSPDEDEDFQNLFQKIKQFEGELCRQKASQHTEFLRLLEENKDLKIKMVEIRKENERFKSIHPITHKAMDKTVEKIEQHFITQKRGIEGKIIEIETELQTNLERTMKEKEMLEHLMKDGLAKLKNIINKLHQKVVGKEIASSPENYDKTERRKLGIDSMIRSVTDIDEEVSTLQRRNKELVRASREKETETRDLKLVLSEITTEINKSHENLTLTETYKRSIIKLPPVDAKLHLIETDTVINKLHDIEEMVQYYKRMISEGNSKNNRDELRPLRSRINKIYEELIKILDPADIPGSSYQKDFDVFLSKAGRERSDEVNQLLRKLSRIDNICQQIIAKRNSVE